MKGLISMTSSIDDIFPEIERAKEDDVKKFILNSPKLFGNTGDATVLFEKNITEYSVIADCLIFTEKKGIIGIEIKTERDNTRRLNKQLQAYSALCDFAWVMCHDSHLEKVKKIIKDHNHKNVGIISYTIFHGEIIAGIIQDANISPNYKPHVVLDLLWKTELYAMARVITDGRATRVNNNEISWDNRSMGSVVSNRMTKPQLIRWLLQTLGERTATQQVCDMFRQRLLDPEKPLKLYKFKEGYLNVTKKGR